MRRFDCLLLVSLLAGCSTVEVRPHRDSETEPDPDPDPSPDPGPDPDPDPDPGPAAFCASSTFPGEAGDAVLATWDDSVIRLVAHDGTVIEHPIFAEVPPADANTSVSVAAGAGLVVVSAEWAPAGDWENWTAHVVWYTKKGEPIATMDEPFRLDPVLVTPDGATVLVRNQLAQADYLVRRADGSTTSFPGSTFTPFGEALPGGWLRGYTSESREGFFNFETLDSKTVGNTEPSTARLFEDGFAYLEAGAPPLFIRETLDGATSLPLFGIGPSDQAPLWMSGSAASHALLRGGASDGLWRADLATGATLAADVLPPAGLVDLDDNCGLQDRRIGSDGLVMAPVRDGGAARMMLFDPVTTTFTPLGWPVVEAGTFEVNEVSGTYFLHAGDGLDSFCPIVGWQGPLPEGSIPFKTTQIIRPSTGSLHVVEWPEDELSPWIATTTEDGICVGIATSAETGWSLLDVISGDSISIDAPGTALIWLE